MDGRATRFTGGLYPDGRNVRPDSHEAAGRAIAAQIVPLNRRGEPDPLKGRIVMISVGMSNTQGEFGEFLSQAKDDPEVNSRLFLLNGAQGGRTSDHWVNPSAPAWREVDARLTRYGLSPTQVQVAWVKQTQTRGGEFPSKAESLQRDLEAIARNLKTNYPNIKIAYFSSRTRSYTYWRGLSPEPVAFETGFAVKWMIEKQIHVDLNLNFDPERGVVKAPYLSWGPYLWVDGQLPRDDGVVWTAADLAPDCTHPSRSGRRKVAAMLMDFFKNDSTTKGWFLATAPLSPYKAAPPMRAPRKPLPYRPFR